MIRISLAFVLVLMNAIAYAHIAGVSDDYGLSWHTIDGGGGTSTGGGFTLSGTIGQPDAGTMSGGGFELTGGFWAGASAEPKQPTCVGDLNNSGAVDVQDLLILLGAWGPNPAHPADLNNSGTVDVQDLLILLGAWGPCP
ncbi:MAG TPA: hypothetical protein PK400_00375 [Phycisphaerales bacterium]|nr:hypothetical protein [Phycisphaerales bacterium]HRQ74501.1 hypothetical protein [Phycisphaerales bacterium]